MNALAGWALLLALGGAVWWYGTPHSPERSYAARGWLSVLRVRFASGSFASWFASLLAPRGEPRERGEPPRVYYDDEMPAARVSYDGGKTFAPVAPRAPNLRGPIPAPVEGATYVEVAPGVGVSGRGSVEKVRRAPLSQGERDWDARHVQVGRPGLMNPPAVRPNETTRSRVADYIRHAEATTDLKRADIIKEAARKFGCTRRLAQLAAKDVGGRTR